MKSKARLILILTFVFLLFTSMTMCVEREKSTEETFRKGVNIMDTSGSSGDDDDAGDDDTGDDDTGDDDDTGGDDDAGDDDDTGPTGKVTLEFWHTFQYAKEVELIEKAVEQFEDDHPNIKVEIQQQTYSDAVNKFQTAAIGGVAPDIIRVPNDRLGELAQMDLIASLDPYISVTLVDSYVDMAIDAMSFKGSYYGLPASYDSMALIYNKELLSQQGYTEPPETLDELVTMAKSLTYGDKYGLVFPITDPYWWFLFQYGFGGGIFDVDGNPTIGSQASEDATDFIFKLESEHRVMPEGGTDKNLMISLFTERKAAMMVTGPWNIQDIKAADIDYGIAPFPKNTATDRHCAPLVGAKGYSIAKDSSHKLEAYQLIQYLTSAEVTKDFALVSDTLPSVLSVYQDQEIMDSYVIQGFLSQAQLGQQAPSIPEMGLVWNPLTDALQLIYSGDKSISKGLADAQAEIESNMS